jgi:hypothetical protein
MIDGHVPFERVESVRHCRSIPVDVAINPQHDISLKSGSHAPSRIHHMKYDARIVLDPLHHEMATISIVVNIDATYQIVVGRPGDE